MTPTIVLSIVALLLVLVLVRWQSDKSSRVDLSDLIIDTKTNKVSLFKIGQAISLLVSTWAFVVMVHRDSLNWEFFITYMGIWAGANVAKMAIQQNKKETKDDSNT